MGFRDVWDRVKEVTGWKKQSEMAAFLEIAGSNISEAKGRDSFPYAWMEKISSEFNVSIDWLSAGKTYPSFPKIFDSRTTVREPEPAWETSTPHNLSGSNEDVSPHKPNYEVEAVLWDSSDADRFIIIPLMDAELNPEDGGFVLSETEHVHSAFQKDWLTTKSTSLENLVLITVRGVSMEGTLQEGDTVLVDRGRQSIHAGGIYALQVGDMVYMKKLELLVGGRVRVISDNREEYPPYDVDEADLHILGQVIWCDRTLV